MLQFCRELFGLVQLGTLLQVIAPAVVQPTASLTLVLGAVKLVAEDLPRSRAATLFVALPVFGGALIAALRVMRARKVQGPGKLDIAEGTGGLGDFVRLLQSPVPSPTQE